MIFPNLSYMVSVHADVECNDCSVACRVESSRGGSLAKGAVRALFTWCLIAITTAAVAQSAFANAEITVDDAGFEATYTGQPTAWTFGPSPTPADGLRFEGLMDSVPFDKTCAFFEGETWVSQELSGFQTGTATVSFYAQGRDTGGAGRFGPNPLKVTMNGVVLTFDKSSTVTPDLRDMTLYTSDPFPVKAGTTYKLVIAGTIPYEAGVTDMTSFVDNVSVFNSTSGQVGASEK